MWIEICAGCCNSGPGRSLPSRVMAIEIWAIRLKQMEPDSEFCFIMCSDEQHVEIRFHKLREDEIGWLSDDIEGYKDEAVGYLIL